MVSQPEVNWAIPSNHLNSLVQVNSFLAFCKESFCPKGYVIQEILVIQIKLGCVYK